MRIQYSLLAGLALLYSAACKRDSDRFATATGASAFMDDASPEAREALAIQVDYRLTDENFAKWEIAQRNLDRLPRSAFPTRSSGARGNVIDRAVARLESSPRARTTIEATGLTVRDFVLQTIALAQATEAAEGGRVAGSGVVPPENFRFVDRHRERIRRAQLAARAARRNAESLEAQVDPEQQMDADTTMASENASIESRSGHSNRTGRTRSDSAESDDDGSPEEPLRDSTRDSVSADGDSWTLK